MISLFTVFARGFATVLAGARHPRPTATKSRPARPRSYEGVDLREPELQIDVLRKARAQWRAELEQVRRDLEAERAKHARTAEALETERFRLQRAQERLDRARARRDAVRAELNEVVEKNKRLFAAAHDHHQRIEAEKERLRAQSLDDVRLLKEIGGSRDRYLAVVEALAGRAAVLAVERAGSGAEAVERVIALLEEDDAVEAAPGAENRV